jgi:dCMP deaminase
MSDVERLREACRYAAERSEDPRTQVGVVFVSASGRSLYAANRMPAGIARHAHRKEPPAKQMFLEHAERAVLYRAAVSGVPTAGGRLYAPWAACTDCARAIIACGIREVIGLIALRNATPERWRSSLWTADQMLTEAGVGIRWINERVGVTIRFDGRDIEC